MKQSGKNVLYLLLAVVLFSFIEIVSKFMDVSPMHITFLRFTIGGLVLLPVAVADLRRRRTGPSPRDWLLLAALSVLNVCVSMNLGQHGIFYADASVSAVLFSANPLFVALFSTFLLREPMNGLKGIGLGVGMVGVVVCFLHVLLVPLDATSPKGVWYNLISAVTFGLYVTCAKKITQKLGSMCVTSATAIIGGLAMIPFMLLRGVSPLAVDFAGNWWQILFMSIFATGLAYFFYFSALEKVDTTLGSMSFFIKPILTSLMAWMLLDERITVNLAVGALLVFTGIYLVKRGVDKAQAPHEPAAAG